MGRYSNLIWIPIEKLKGHFLNEELFGKPTEKEMEKFVESFKEVGQIEVITVMENGDGTYTILSGHQRVEAAKRVGQKEVPARIFYPDYKGEEKRVLIYSNVIRRDASSINFDKISEVLATCKPPSVLREELIPELAQFIGSGKVSLEVLSLFSQYPKEKQREFVFFIRTYQELEGEKKMELKDLQLLEQAEEELKKEKPELAKEIERLKEGLLTKEKLITSLKQELVVKQKMHELMLEGKRKLEEEVKKLKEKIDETKENRRKEEELKDQLRRYEENIREKEEELEKAKIEIIALKHKIEEQKKEITGLKHLDKIYREKVEEIKERLKRQVEEKMREVARKKQELVSDRFREEVFSFYRMNPGLSDQLREVYKWFVSHEYQFKAMEAFLGEVRQKIKILFAPENYPAQTLPDEIVEVKRKWIALLDHLAKAAEETADLAAKAHPNEILKGIVEMSEKLRRKTDVKK